MALDTLLSLLETLRNGAHSIQGEPNCVDYQYLINTSRHCTKCLEQLKQQAETQYQQAATNQSENASPSMSYPVLEKITERLNNDGVGNQQYGRIVNHVSGASDSIPQTTRNLVPPGTKRTNPEPAKQQETAKRAKRQAYGQQAAKLAEQQAAKRAEQQAAKRAEQQAAKRAEQQAAKRAEQQVAKRALIQLRKAFIAYRKHRNSYLIPQGRTIAEKSAALDQFDDATSTIPFIRRVYLVSLVDRYQEWVAIHTERREQEPQARNDIARRERVETSALRDLNCEVKNDKEDEFLSRVKLENRLRRGRKWHDLVKTFSSMGILALFTANHNDTKIEKMKKSDFEDLVSGMRTGADLLGKMSKKLTDVFGVLTNEYPLLRYRFESLSEDDIGEQDDDERLIDYCSVETVQIKVPMDTVSQAKLHELENTIGKYLFRGMLESHKRKREILTEKHSETAAVVMHLAKPEHDIPFVLDICVSSEVGKTMADNNVTNVFPGAILRIDVISKDDGEDHTVKVTLPFDEGREILQKLFIHPVVRNPPV